MPSSRKYTANEKHAHLSPGLLGTHGIRDIFLFLSLLLVTLVYSPALMDASLLPRVLALALTLTLTAGLMLLHFQQIKSTFPHGLFGLSVFGVYAAMITWMLTSLFYAPNPSEAFVGILFQFNLLSYLFFFTLLIQANAASQTKVIQSICIFGLIAALSGIIQYRIEFPNIELNVGNLYRVTGLFSHKNLFSEALFLALPFCIMGIFLTRGKWKWLSMITASVLLLMNVLLMVRSVWVALLLAFLQAVILMITFRKTLGLKRLQLRNIILGCSLGLALAFAGILVYSHYFTPKSFKQRIDEMTQRRYGTTRTRIILWENTWKMILDQPLTGTGTGNWKIRIPAYQIHDKLDAKSNMRIQRPHNDFLWILSENGIPGLILHLLFIGLIYRYAWKVMRHAVRQEDKWCVLVLLSGITGYLVISFFSFPRERVEHNILFLTMVSLIARPYLEMRNDLPKMSERWMRMGVYFILFISLLGVVVSMMRIKGEYHVKQAFAHMKTKRHMVVKREISKAYSFLYTLDPFSTPVLWYKGIAQYQDGEREAAEHTFHQAYRHNPWHSHVLTSLAILHEDDQESEQALAVYREALTYNPKYKTARWRMINLLLDQNEFGEAIEELLPLKRMEGDPYFEQYVQRAVKGRLMEFFDDLHEDVLSGSWLLQDSTWLRGVFIGATWSNKPIEMLATRDILSRSGISEEQGLQSERDRITEKANKQLTLEGRTEIQEQAP